VPTVLRGADYFKSVNANVNHNPKVDIYIDDIYSFLSYSNKEYDLISSDGKFGVLNKSNTTMLSQDYYRQCADHLSEKGIFVQWVSTQIPNAHLKTVLSTTASVFPYSELFLLRKNLFILSSKSAMPMSASKVNAALKNSEIASDMFESEIFSPLDMLSSYIGTNKVTGKLNTFDHPVLEYDYILERSKDVEASRASDFRNFRFLRDKYLENESAIKASENTITNNPEFVSYSSNRKYWESRYHFFLANHALLDGDKAKAYEAFSKVVSIDHPANSNDIAVSAKHIGVFNLDTKRYTDAIKFFDVAIKKVPGYSNAYTLKGVSLYYLDRFDSSRVYFNTALELNPKDQTAREFLSVLDEQ
jgi:tetratricopeptide (TPR) repeat protein